MAIADPASKFAGRVTSGGARQRRVVRALQSGIEKGRCLDRRQRRLFDLQSQAGTIDLEASAIGFGSQTVTDRWSAPDARPSSTSHLRLCAFASESVLLGPARSELQHSSPHPAVTGRGEQRQLDRTHTRPDSGSGSDTITYLVRETSRCFRARARSAWLAHLQRHSGQQEWARWHL